MPHNRNTHSGRSVHQRPHSYVEDGRELKQRLGYNVVTKAIPLTVSSRGIGFGVQHLAFATSSQRKFEMTDVYALYRVFLGVFEAKIQTVSQFYCDIIDASAMKASKLDYKFITAARSITRLPEPIHRIIGMIGPVMHSKIRYLPCLPKDIYIEGRFVPEPTTVVLTNLRDVVVALSDPNTPRTYRSKFRTLNPIPGTKWDSEDVLLNADTIMPAEYNTNLFNAELFEMLMYVNLLEQYLPNMKGGTNPIMEVQGRKSIFVSNNPVSICQPELMEDEPLKNLYGKMPRGDIDLFWSQFELGWREWFEGVMCLVGENSVYEEQHLPLQIARSSTLGSHRLTSTYWGVNTIAL